MSSSNLYWVGSKVPYGDYLRGQESALAGAEQVASAINAQTRDLVRSINGVSQELGAINRTLHWGFGMVILELASLNETLKELLKTAKTPAQTAAMEQFDIARDCVRRKLFPDALQAVDAAISGNSASPGYKMEWRFHFLKGTLHLGSFENNDPAVLDLEKAEASFLEAARYAQSDFPQEAARALTAASWATLVRSGGDKALIDRANTHARKALDTWKSLNIDQPLTPCGDSHFQAAKIAAVRGDGEELTQRLLSAFSHDYAFLARASDDGDISSQQAANAALETFLQERRNWLTTETERRIQVLKHHGIDDALTGGGISRVQGLVAAPGSTLTYAGPGQAPTPTEAYTKLWDELVGQSVPEVQWHEWGWKDADAPDWSHTITREPYSDIDRQKGHPSAIVAFEKLPLSHRPVGIKITLRKSTWTGTISCPRGKNDQGRLGVQISVDQYDAKQIHNGKVNKLSLRPYNQGVGVYEYDKRTFAVSVHSGGKYVKTAKGDEWVYDPDDGGITVLFQPNKEPRLLPPPGLLNCFPAKTQIADPVRSQSIVSLSPGAVVLDAAGKARKVLAVSRHPTTPVHRVTFEDNTHLRVTLNHSISTPTGWARVSDLRPGDTVHRSGNKTAQVRSVEADGFEPTYNLIVEGGEFVADGVRVHSHTTLRALRTVLWDLLGPRMAPIEQACVSGHAFAMATLHRLRSAALPLPTSFARR